MYINNNLHFMSISDVTLTTDPVVKSLPVNKATVMAYIPSGNAKQTTLDVGS